MTRWETVHQGTLERHGILALRHVERRSPRTGKLGTYQVLELPPFVNVLALTEADEVVMVRQYRHGTDAVTLEIPGGLVDAGESPLEAGLRELAEETGYAGEGARILGTCHPNPAIQGNLCHTVWVPRVRQVAGQALDEGEHLEVVLVPRADLPRLVREGAITHALVLVALHLWGLEPGR
jgi:8-oxo-dGTP pyrophosphatase MutT (NUDIX family)